MECIICKRSYDINRALQNHEEWTKETSTDSIDECIFDHPDIRCSDICRAVEAVQTLTGWVVY